MQFFSSSRSSLSMSRDKERPTASHSQRSFHPKELRDMQEEIEKIRAQQKKLDSSLEQVSLQLIEKKFDKKLLDNLEQLERQELELESRHMRLCKDYYLAKQKIRREILKLEKDKQPEVSIVDEVLNEASLDVIETRVFGKSTKSFLGKGQELTHDLSTWELDASEIRVFERQKLGKGTFGKVVRGQLRGKTVAVKTIDINWKVDGEVHTKILDDFRNECSVMTKLLHPNVLLLMGVCIEPDQGKLIMVTELMPRGSVFDLLHSSTHDISFKQRMRFARDTALGMNWLHLSSPPILHLDLKTQNILVDENWVSKVADFGLSRVRRKEQRGAVGSPLYMAPEVLSEMIYNDKADVYSFGIVLWELVTGLVPYEEQNFETVADVYKFVVKEQKRLTVPEYCPLSLAKLIQTCWDPDPAKRPTFKDIIESQILDQVIVEGIISDSNAAARGLWMKSFRTKQGAIRDVVPFKEFISACIKQCRLNLPRRSKWKDILEFKALHLVLAPNAENLKSGTVSLEEFGRVLEWFGPFTLDEQFPKHVVNIIKIEGFFGDITSENAERQMAGKKVGTYMIRFSSKPGYYTITAMESEGQLKHFRIKHRSGTGYFLGSQEYPSLCALLKARKNDLGLKKPLGGSKYAQLILAHEAQLDANYAHLST